MTWKPSWSRFLCTSSSPPARESFAVLRSRWFRAHSGVCGSYESQTAAAAEITDDSDGLVEAIADSTTTEITDDSNGREVAIANTTTAAIKGRRRISVRDGVYERLKETATHQGKPLTQVVNEAIEAYLKSTQEDYLILSKSKIGSTATTSDPPQLQDQALLTNQQQHYLGRVAVAGG